MAVKLRMKRLGNTHRPYYRVVSVDERRKRDGRVIEELGTYNPLDKSEADQVKLKLDRCAYWLSVGAQPSDTVASLLKRSGLIAKAGTALDAQPEDLQAAAAAAKEKIAAAQSERDRIKAEEKAKAAEEAAAEGEGETAEASAEGEEEKKTE